MVSEEEVTESKWHDFNTIIKNRSKCTRSCPMHINCPLSVHAPVCMVKTIEGEDRRRFFMFFYLGETGLRSEILYMLMEFAKKLDLTKAIDLRIYLETLLRVNRQLYGEKTKQVAQPETLKVNITRAQGNRKNVPTIILSEEDSTTDSESLFSSPKLSEIVS